MGAERFYIDHLGERRRTPARQLLPCPQLDRIRKLDPAERRLVKQIARGRMRGDTLATIAMAVGLTVHRVTHLVAVLGIPSTTEYRRRWVLKLHRRGWSAEAVATRLGITLRLVNTLRADLGLPPFPRGTEDERSALAGRPVHHSPLRTKVAELHAEGVTARAIATRLGVSRQTVYVWLKTLKSN